MATNKRTILIGVLFGLAASGCATIKENRIETDEVVRVTRAEAPTVGPAVYVPTATPSADGAVLRIDSYRSCGYGSTKTLRREVTIERTIEHVGGGTATAGVLGAASLLVGLLTLPNSDVRPVSISSIAAGSALFIPVFVDMYRARDTTMPPEEVVVPIEAVLAERCDSKPLANAEVALGSATRGVRRSFGTDDHGRIALDWPALEDLSRLQVCDHKRQCSGVYLYVGGNEVDLSSSSNLQTALLQAQVREARRVEAEREAARAAEAARKREEERKDPRVWAKTIEYVLFDFVQHGSRWKDLVDRGYVTVACDQVWPILQEKDEAVCKLIAEARTHLDPKGFSSLPDLLFRSIAYRSGDREAGAARGLLKDYMSKPQGKCGTYIGLKCK